MPIFPVVWSSAAGNCLLWHTIFSLTRKSRACHIRISLRLIMLPSAAWRRRCSVPLLSSGASSRIIGSFSSWFSAKGSIDLHPFGSCTFGTRYSLGADLCSRRLFVGPAVVALLETFRKIVTFRFVSNTL